MDDLYDIVFRDSAVHVYLTRFGVSAKTTFLHTTPCCCANTFSQ